jgi:type VI protein secretion system component VasK
MIRLWLVLGVVVALVYIYSIVDCALIEKNRVRGLPKAVWLLVLIFLPVIGSVLWFLIGRGRRPGAGRGSLAPDDDPEFLKHLSQERARRDREQEQRIRKLEADLAGLDDPDTAKGPKKPNTATDTATTDAAKKKNNGESDQPGRADA